MRTWYFNWGCSNCNTIVCNRITTKSLVLNILQYTRFNRSRINRGVFDIKELRRTDHGWSIWCAISTKLCRWVIGSHHTCKIILAGSLYKGTKICNLCFKLLWCIWTWISLGWESHSTERVYKGNSSLRVTLNSC